MTMSHVLWARRAAADRQLDPTTRLVLLTLATYASRTGAAWPSAQTLAGDCGLHRETVRQRLASLAEVRPALFADVVRPSGRRPAVFQFPNPTVEAVDDCNNGELDTVEDCVIPLGGNVDTVPLPVEAVLSAVEAVGLSAKRGTSLEVSIGSPPAGQDHVAGGQALACARDEPDRIRGFCPECGHQWSGHRPDTGCCYRCPCRAPRPRWPVR